MATNIELKSQIDTDIINKTLPNSVTRANVGNTFKNVIDYVDQEISTNNTKTSIGLTLSAIQQVLPSDINSVNFSGGKAYLPNTTVIGKEILVISNSSAIEIFANVGNTNKMFVNFNTFVNKVTMGQYEMYKFTYIGFGTGVGGLVDGFWKAEII